MNKRGNTSHEKKEICQTNPLSSKITYANLFWLFLFGSITGFVVEGLWSIFLRGSWENHSATIWGPFCIVYGIGAMLFYIISSFIDDKKLMLQFLLLSGAGALVEYFSSLFQEAVFGSKSWNYSRHFFNIGGRISLKMALGWGVMGVLFVRILFPLLVRVLDKMNTRPWNIACVILSMLMAFNLIMSAAAVWRWRERLQSQTPPSNALEQFFDQNYDNPVMEKIYRNMKFTEN